MHVPTADSCHVSLATALHRVLTIAAHTHSRLLSSAIVFISRVLILPASPCDTVVMYYEQGLELLPVGLQPNVSAKRIKLGITVHWDTPPGMGIHPVAAYSKSTMHVM